MPPHFRRRPRHRDLLLATTPGGCSRRAHLRHGDPVHGRGPYAPAARRSAQRSDVPTSARATGARWLRPAAETPSMSLWRPGRWGRTWARLAQVGIDACGRVWQRLRRTPSRPRHAAFTTGPAAGVTLGSASGLRRGHRLASTACCPSRRREPVPVVRRRAARATGERGAGHGITRDNPLLPQGRPDRRGSSATCLASTLLCTAAESAPRRERRYRSSTCASRRLRGRAVAGQLQALFFACVTARPRRHAGGHSKRVEPRWLVWSRGKCQRWHPPRRTAHADFPAIHHARRRHRHA